MNEFVGADMARKYLQMGYTRARRYANHKGGRKYDPSSGVELPLNVKDTDKEESAQIFYKMLEESGSKFCLLCLKKRMEGKVRII